MRVLICGDRNWTNALAIEARVRTLPAGSVIIEGACRGADMMARIAAEKCGLTVLEFPADWKTYGKAAGPMRNAKMLREGKPDVVWAFHNDIANSRGTRDMVLKARAAGIPVEIFADIFTMGVNQ